MSTRLEGFRGEYLWELDIAERQLLTLAEAFAAQDYEWRPAPAARSTREVLIHIAAGTFTLLAMVGVDAAPDLYGDLLPEVVPRMTAMLAKNDLLEKTRMEKVAVLDLLKRSLVALRTAFSEAGTAGLERQDVFFGEPTTVRRVYMRGLSHLHEHMGQLIAYTRAMGMPAPWTEWRESGRRAAQQGQPS